MRVSPLYGLPGLMAILCGAFALFLLVSRRETLAGAPITRPALLLLGADFIRSRRLGLMAARCAWASPGTGRVPLRASWRGLAVMLAS